ncbi:hypothetical protein INT44_005565 [Umbelopsis vinacea]|uniref:Uncharacterized protein n=1 Tax=Umbelopsis vinacea TaxID=44442 RepID=A0A8H7UA69_9FUNG|nr:hypothetical protein INT44_005565 [Umbelopsis vinacea]
MGSCSQGELELLSAEKINSADKASESKFSRYRVHFGVDMPVPLELLQEEKRCVPDPCLWPIRRNGWRWSLQLHLEMEPEENHSQTYIMMNSYYSNVCVQAGIQFHEGSSAIWVFMVRSGQKWPTRKVTNAKLRPKAGQPKLSAKVKTEIVYEVAGFTDKQRSQRAAAILKRALNPEAVIFEFKSTDLDPAVEVDEIAKQMGEVIGYTNLGMYRRDTNGLILEIVFKSSESTQPGKDLEVNINGVIIKGSRWVDERRLKSIFRTFPYVSMIA